MFKCRGLYTFICFVLEMLKTITKIVNKLLNFPGQGYRSKAGLFLITMIPTEECLRIEQQSLMLISPRPGNRSYLLLNRRYRQMNVR